MDSEELDSQRRQERLQRRRQRECDARARETAEQREARLARRRERYRAQRRQESQHTHTWSTNNISCSLLRLAPQCPHSLVYNICIVHGTTVTHGATHTQYTVHVPKYSAQYRSHVVMFVSSTAQACNIHCHVIKHRYAFKLLMRISSNRDC